MPYIGFQARFLLPPTRQAVLGGFRHGGRWYGERPQACDNERDETMKTWNDLDADVDVLVLNSAISSAGLNCHGHCWVGIGVGFVWNVATELQFIGRPLRIGQKRKGSVQPCRR
ncbi:hypothetical protein CONLIGDRAFT_697720 [Coniochaeta ligniaria NRRL 30616]|uniref:Helicase C-terminal domain-containing protein n=1 Tax=Coniochaeta ligniaria NRRL 30616 TaxID=1408157 RepID=A0A1J7JQB3_9PEZI|nr:hypothetical protein CONLIGDRAFT_697720 [Coniochaeta ligniaria NRRL 30616]